MSLNLKESPKEWMKFTAAMAVALGGMTVLLWARGAISQYLLTAALALLSVGLLVCLLRPGWFRGFYRLGMTGGFHLGRLVGTILLAIFFCLVLAPLGLFLRILGKDLLVLKKAPSTTTYWRPAKVDNEFDRQF
jgi:hypothetical protein